MVSRRKLIQAGLLSPLAPAGIRAQNREAIQRYVTLGKTELRVSEIGFGSSGSERESLVRRALDKGVTLFDAAESYRSGRSETAIGKALKGARDKVVLTSKTKAYADTTEKEMMAALEGSLARLQTDYLDIYFNHAVNHVERMQSDAWANFTEKAIAQGKIRFRGMSGHGSRLAPCLEYAIDNDLVDVILCAYNFGEDPDIYDRLRHTFHFVAIQSDLPPVLDKAKAKNIGVIAMKTLMGARLNDMRQFESGDRSYAQAALRWVLASERVDAALISMTSDDRIDEYIAASAQDDDVAGDVDLLGRYAALRSGSYCHHGCNHCEDVCPAGVDIPEVLRTRMYEVDYRNRALALEDYKKLGSPASACVQCDGSPCGDACPYGLPVPAFTFDTHRRLG